ncbi:DUF1318 domain-containing protein [Oleiharenicola lentus]|jgi:uncharacterized protein YdbL (DUF1318 family)|uniref:DUF1318 domain-containing protein n=1 Tax=Oleiharenicola lentus TaxID=2508720 RepID=A0A4Q1CCW9_9BACT|nr:YdbL family protein [Oleiharenicola lentus]RXK56801.1 DUF1318 domain-containing protein [Oleiharenicola lentus]
MTSRLLTCLAFVTLSAVVAHADSAADLRRRMEQRLPAIDALKAEGAVGENNRGFLEVPPAGKAGSGTVITDENRDREAVYALIAKQTGATPEAVGKARARQIASGSKAGVWIQDEGGQWKKK